MSVLAAYLVRTFQ